MINDRISGLVWTFNSERSIVACLDSLRFCEEIIVVDANSSDGTASLAKQRGAVVVIRDWMQACAEKMLVADLAIHNWILAMDADECASAGLTSEIVRLRPYGLGQYAAYEMRVDREGCMHTSVHQLRLFDRRRARFCADTPELRVVSFGPVGTLRGHLAKRE